MTSTGTSSVHCPTLSPIGPPHQPRDSSVDFAMNLSSLAIDFSAPGLYACPSTAS